MKFTVLFIGLCWLSFLSAKRLDPGILRMTKKLSDNIQKWFGYSSVEISTFLRALYLMLYVAYGFYNFLETHSAATAITDSIKCCIVVVLLWVPLDVKRNEDKFTNILGEGNSEMVRTSHVMAIQSIRIFFLAIYIYHATKFAVDRYFYPYHPTQYQRMVVNIDFIQEHIKLLFLYFVSSDPGPTPKKTRLKELTEKVKEALTPAQPLVTT